MQYLSIAVYYTYQGSCPWHSRSNYIDLHMRNAACNEHRVNNRISMFSSYKCVYCTNKTRLILTNCMHTPIGGYETTKIWMAQVASCRSCGHYKKTAEYFNFWQRHLMTYLSPCLPELHSQSLTHTGLNLASFTADFLFSFLVNSAWERGQAQSRQSTVHGVAILESVNLAKLSQEWFKVKSALSPTHRSLAVWGGRGSWLSLAQGGLRGVHGGWAHC